VPTVTYASRLLFLPAVLMKLRAAYRYMTAPKFLEQNNFVGWVLLSLLLALLPIPAALADGQPQPKRVSILYSFENEIGLLSGFAESLRAALKSGGIGPVEFHTAFLDRSMFSGLPRGSRTSTPSPRLKGLGARRHFIDNRQ
jgi:hypothetical protein